MKDENKKKDQGKDVTTEQKLEEAKKDGRDLADEQLDGVAGGTTPIISPWS